MGAEGRTRVGIIGPGRVGTALAIGLTGSQDYTVTAVAGRSAKGLRHFARVAPDAVVMDARELAQSVELILICVADDDLEDVVRDLAKADAFAAGVRVAHTAGGHGLGVLHLAALAGARVAACHPAQTFPDPETGAAGLAGTAWAVTAGAADWEWAADLVQALRGTPVEVADSARTLYHAALALGANGTSSVVGLARELLLAAGVAKPEEFLEPLVSAAGRNAARQGAAALTGPVRRGDAGTVARHLVELGIVMPDAAEAYLALAKLALRQALRAGLPQERAEAVRVLLEEG